MDPPVTAIEAPNVIDVAEIEAMSITEAFWLLANVQTGIAPNV